MISALIALALIGQEPQVKSSILGESPAKPEATSEGAFKVGAKSHLHLGDSFETSIPAAPSLAAFELMVKHVRESGDDALEKLLHDDTIWDVENYADVEILKIETGNRIAVEVKILDGAFENRTAFVTRSCVSPGPAPLEPFPELGYSFKDKRKIMTAWLHLSHIVDGRPEVERKKDGGAGFLAAQEKLFTRLNLNQDLAKEIMTEVLAKRVHIGKALIEDNPQAERYTVAPSPEPAIDPEYKPRVGDVAYLYSGGLYKKGPRAGQHTDAPICSDYFAFRAFEKALAAKDDEGYDELQDKGKVVHVRTGTRVRILDFHRFPGDEDIRDAIEVRLLDGPLKGKKAWAIDGYVVRPIQRQAVVLAPKKGKTIAEIDKEMEDAAVKKKAEEEEAADKKKAEEKAGMVARKAADASPEKTRRCAALLSVARNLEKSGKSDAATAQYRRIIKDFPDSAEAKAAAERLRSLRKE